MAIAGQGGCLKSAHGIFRYEGRSMWPCFQEGDLLEWQPLSYSRVRIGDCIAYQTVDGRKAAHRVVGKGNGLATRGDALTESDCVTVSEEQFIGRIVRRHRLAKDQTVTGGRLGCIVGWFYHYAGRIDPNRPGRGGRLARKIRTLSKALLGLCGYEITFRSMHLANQQSIEVLEFAGRLVGKTNPDSSAIDIAWPWSVILESPSRPCKEKAIT